MVPKARALANWPSDRHIQREYAKSYMKGVHVNISKAHYPSRVRDSLMSRCGQQSHGGTEKFILARNRKGLPVPAVRDPKSRVITTAPRKRTPLDSGVENSCVTGGRRERAFSLLFSVGKYPLGGAHAPVQAAASPREIPRSASLT
ncbi:hypothetical protein CDAR_75851 [Caerostris darwini]|uniref:Uncharacterized protein n=1 Tax=Caerostris darwini TaxID=1538125 RepID=A0AAV4W0C0_9ARAC|nr:hypothetical protein CDAR_75851 [Caerostris darwini]